MKSRIENLLLVALAFSCISTCQAEEKLKSGGDPPPGAGGPAIHGRDTRDVVFFGPKHPVFLRIHFDVDGRGLSLLRDARSAAIFKNLDKNSDGFLDQREAEGLRTVVEPAETPVLPRPDWTLFDTAPVDGRISLDELVRWMDAAESGFVIAAAPQRAAQNVDLFPKLDLNQDRRLSASELADGDRALSKLDVNDDETFAIAELQPFENPLAPRAGMQGGAVEVPLKMLSSTGPTDAVESELSKRYAKAGAGWVANAESLGVSAAAVKPFDQDSNGILDREELVRLLHNPPIAVELRVELYQKERKRPRIVRLGEQAVAVEEGGPPPETPSRPVVRLDGVDVEFRANSLYPVNSDNKQFYKLRFRTADRDKNKYLDEQEFSAIGLMNADFSTVDRDADGKIFEEELLDYTDRDSDSASSKVFISMGSDGKSVFEILDANLDRRLSRRELRHAAERLAPFDTDRDGSISESELAGRYRVAFELGKPALFRASAATPAQPTDPVVLKSTAGPDWFTKMDRNRDGDVSWREFLGSRESFEKLDSDGDGLINAEEAEKAGK